MSTPWTWQGYSDCKPVKTALKKQEAGRREVLEPEARKLAARYARRWKLLCVKYFQDPKAPYTLWLDDMEDDT